MPVSAERTMRPPRTLTAAVAATGLLLTLGCGSGTEDVAMSEGQALFQETCIQCHGPQGLGDGPMAASLPVQPASLIEHLAHHTRAQLVQLVTGGIPPGMPPQPLTEEEVLQVVDYIWTLVPADQVEALRAMQQQVEAAGGMGAMPGMGGMGSDTSGGMPSPGMEMDHSGHAMPQGN